MNKKLKKVLKACSTLVVVLVLTFAMLVAGVRVFGLRVYTVLSPSMEPELKTGALIYVKEVDADELKVGDVITFMISRETTVTHRIIEILEDDSGTRYFRTKGDANPVEAGGSVHQNNVLGKPIFSIPYLGYAASFITKPPGMYLAVAVGLILTILVFMVDYITSDNIQEKQIKKEEKDK